MNKREQSPIYQTRSTRVLYMKDIRREGRGPQVALAAVLLLALIAVGALLGQGLRTSAEPAAPTAVAQSGAERERVLSELSEGAAAAPAVAPTAAPQAPAAPAARTLQVSGTDGSGLRLRPAPGTAGAPVAVLPEGAVVTPTGNSAQAEGMLWREVAAEGGLSGWAAADYLR